jgi:hypothetical protein
MNSKQIGGITYLHFLMLRLVLMNVNGDTFHTQSGPHFPNTLFPISQPGTCKIDLLLIMLNGELTFSEF